MDSASEVTSSVTVRELCRISPSSSNLTTINAATFPLTFFDLYWFRTPPVELIFFYPLPSSSGAADVFYSDVLPTLKLSLSAALSYFYPVAASLTWPSDSLKPFLLYDSSSAGVSLTVAESTADFNALASSDQIRGSRESHPYIPVLPSSDSEAAVIALQITLFPNQGFCIGVSNHHAVIDGKSATLFIKAWAHLSNAAVASSSLSLPEELTPFVDRSIVQDQEGVDQAFLDFWAGLAHPEMDNPSPRSLKLAPSLMDNNSSDSVRGTFLLSEERIQMLRERVTTTMMKNYGDIKKIRLSSFAITFAHTVVCLVKARGLGIGSDADRKVVHFGFTADSRGRLKPPLPGNYLGNCVVGRHEKIEIEQLVKEEEEEGGEIGYVVERISRMIDDVEEKPTLEKDKLSRLRKSLKESRGVFIGIAGSPKFNVYGADFGWGRPKLVEITSIDRTAGSISMAECWDGSRGIEVGLVLKAHEMELFRSIF